MKTFSLIFILAMAMSCSSKQVTQQKIDEKVAQESVTDGRSLFFNIQEVIQNSKTLNDQQKKQLNGILTDISQKNKKLMSESFKLRSVLIKELISGQVDRKQVKMLKKNIRKLENERQKNSLSAIDQISSVVSKDPEREKIMQEMINIDRINH